MRSIVCRYETESALAAALASRDRELTVIRRTRSSDAPPESVSRGAADGEWVLAIIEVGAEGHATAAAARVRRHGDQLALAFEARDWERIQSLGDRDPPTDKSPEARAQTRMKSKAPAGVGARILIVDDDTEVRDVLAAMLEAVGFAVTAARTGEDGLATLKRASFDLVVLDWMLPGMSGLDLCRAIRARWVRLPVLFVTANASPEDVVDAFARGADDYVVKPFRAPELGARIFGLLRRARESAKA